MVYPLLAQVESLGLDANSNAAKDIIEQNQSVGREIQIATQQVWPDVLQGPLFLSICNVAAILFALSFLVLLFRWVRGRLHDKVETAANTIETLMAVALIVLLFGTPVNRGRLLGTIALQSHAVIDGGSNFVVKNLSSTVQGDVIAQASAKASIEAEFPQSIESCLGIDDVKKRDFCLLRVDDKVKGDLQAFRGNGWSEELYNRYHNYIQTRISKDSKDDFDPLNTVGSVVQSAVGAIGGGVAYLVIRGVLISFGSAFLMILQYAGILTALVSPFFIAAAFYASAYQPILMWAVCFFGLGFVNLLYKIVLGLVSLTVLKSPPSDPLIFPMIISIGSIPLSIWLTRAGGIAILGGVASYASSRK
jgi:hypothetical protein